MRNVDGLDDDDDGVQPKKRKLTKSASRSSLDQFGGELDSPTGSLSQMSAGGSEGGWDEGPSGGGGGGPASKAAANKGKGKKAAKPSSPLNSDDEGELPPVSQNSGGKGLKDEEEEEEGEENVDQEFTKHSHKEKNKMKSVMVQFTPDQMSRYECFRRSGFQRANMRRLLSSVAGCPISVPMTIVMSGIAKMFVGELVETGRTVMAERGESDSGPIRPCHIREAYRRLKLENKVPLKHRPRLFR